MSWPAPVNSNDVANASSASDLGPSVIVPAGVTVTLTGAGNGGIGDTIKVIRFINSGTATTVTLTDGDGTPYADPKGSGNLIPNPFNARVIQGANASLTAPPDCPLFNQPSFSGSWKITTAANVSVQVFGDFS